MKAPAFLGGSNKGETHTASGFFEQHGVVDGKLERSLADYRKVMPRRRVLGTWAMRWLAVGGNARPKAKRKQALLLKESENYKIKPKKRSVKGPLKLINDERTTPSRSGRKQDRLLRAGAAAVTLPTLGLMAYTNVDRIPIANEIFGDDGGQSFEDFLQESRNSSEQQPAAATGEAQGADVGSYTFLEGELVCRGPILQAFRMDQPATPQDESRTVVALTAASGQPFTDLTGDRAAQFETELTAIQPHLQATPGAPAHAPNAILFPGGGCNF